MCALPCNKRSALSIAAACLGVLVSLLPALARAKEPDNTGFVPMFKGKDASGWETTGNWGFESDGAVALRPTYRRLRLIPDYKSFLWTKESYEDFILDLEFKVAKEGNSGIFVRSSSTRSYIQTQISDSHGKKKPLDNMDCGAVVGVAAPSKNMSKPAGEWNHMIITCEQDRMQVELNGEEVIDLDLTESHKTRTAHSGRIAFENMNSPVAFRNVRIKELKQKK
jgi:hypothetical protein